MTQTVLLGDVCRYVNDKVSVDGVTLESYVSTENLIADKGGLELAAKLPETGRATKFQEGDVLVSNIRPYFKKIWFANRAGGASNDVLVFRPTTKDLSQEFLFWVLANDRFFDFSTKSSGGSKMPRGDKNQIMKYKVNLPSLDRQKKIVDILGSINAKIELNRKMNETLEQMGQALFRHYFIDNPEAEKWDKRELGEFFPIKTGKKDANFGTGDGAYPFFTCAQTISKAPDFSFDAHAILLAGNGDFNLKLYRGKFEAYQRTYVLIPKDERFVGVLFFLMKEKLLEITGGSRGSVIKFITKGMIENYRFLLPSDAKLVEVADVFNQLTVNIEENVKQIQTLTTLRDTLLPRLINGKLRL